MKKHFILGLALALLISTSTVFIQGSKASPVPKPNDQKENLVPVYDKNDNFTGWIDLNEEDNFTDEEIEEMLNTEYPEELVFYMKESDLPNDIKTHLGKIKYKN